MSEYLYGETWREKENFKGLIPKLSQRIGLLKILNNKKISRENFHMIATGIFTSVLLYCIPVFGNVWGVRNMDLENRRYTSFGKEDLRRLQVLQNKMCRLKTGLPYDTPTSELLKKADELSVYTPTSCIPNTFVGA